MIGGCDPCCGGGTPCDLVGCGYALDDFADAEITDTTLIASGGTAATVAFDSVQDTDVGLVAPSRKLTIEQSGTATDDTRGYAILFPVDAIWTPNSMCSIDSVSYCVNALLDGAATIVAELLLVCRQGGELYVRDRVHLLTAEWTRFRGTCTAADFDHLDPAEFAPDSTTHPDFSVDGDPVQFGVAFRGTIDQGQSDLAGMAWIDNLCVTVSRGTDCGPCEHAECHGGQYSVTIQGFALNSYAGSSSLILQSRDVIEDFFTSTMICGTFVDTSSGLSVLCESLGCGCRSALVSSGTILVPAGLGGFSSWDYAISIQFHFADDNSGLVAQLSFSVGQEIFLGSPTIYSVQQCLDYTAPGSVFPSLVLTPNNAVEGYFNGSSSSTVADDYGWTFTSITFTPLP